MRCNHIVAALEELLLLGSELMLLALFPGFAGSDHLCSVDVKLENVIVRELNPKILVEVGGIQLDSAAHIDILVFSGPGVGDVGVFTGSSPGCGLFFPSAVVEILLRPVCAVLRVVVHLSLPHIAVESHAGDRLQEVLLTDPHETIGSSIHAEDAFDGFFMFAPHSCRTCVQRIVIAPDGEVRIVDQQRHRRKSQVSLFVRNEILGSLCRHCQSSCTCNKE